MGELKSFNLVDKNNKSGGTIKVLKTAVAKEHSFLEFLSGGCQISLICAVDFTGSNGVPTDPRSLHSIASPETQYEAAIKAIGECVGPYDSDGVVPMFGFGAKMNGQVSHCFPMAPNGCRGVPEMLSAYRGWLSSVELYGPTIFSQVLDMATQQASQAQTQQNQNYTILLILTDGVITDMDESIKRIVAASNLPLSVIIIGVGSADFSNMNALDGDGKMLTHHGVKAKRDIVQFVPFNDFVNKPREMLAKATLAEVPGQLLSFMKSRGFVPNVRQ
jgi:hypothetical protein